MTNESKKLILALAVIFAANIFIIALAQNAWADLYKKGNHYLSKHRKSAPCAHRHKAGNANGAC